MDIRVNPEPRLYRVRLECEVYLLARDDWWAEEESKRAVRDRPQRFDVTVEELNLAAPSICDADLDTVPYNAPDGLTLGKILEEMGHRRETAEESAARAEIERLQVKFSFADRDAT